MAAVHENQTKRYRRTRQFDGRRCGLKVCKACQRQTRWLSIDYFCWECTISLAKTKIPLHTETADEETKHKEVYLGFLGNW
ncbi:hypothetical protein CEE37_04210 [candidate division LCP-89 bacterium B3_LCP]|uniref:Uncharacterized protein n=1 Tax=candidate division LCP-89 bacterium B3_LCP TaxID=2012998 RepID=A0A532V3Q2_UNCL8|nr:MAG: hypothetical protein CEE37_04210 [candidate division LCP-89 bacterium B3_LCP]